MKSPPPRLQHAVGTVFYLSQYDTFEGGQQMVHLSAPILIRSIISAFTGSIEVDITAEDLSNDDPQQNAQFGRHYLHCLSIKKFVVVRLLATLVSQSTAQLPCKL